jgi:DNA-directed RNA polymerase specialized sigma24 family protein
MASHPPASPGYPTFSLAALADPDHPDHEPEWARFFNHYDPRLRDYFQGPGGGAGNLDDLMGPLWSRAFIRIGSLRQVGAAWEWLRKIGNNLLKDATRHAAARDRATLTFSALAATEEAQRLEDDELPDIGGDGELDDLTVDEREAMGRWGFLSDEERSFMRAIYEDKLSHSQAAERFGLPSAAASKTRYSRIRKRLRGGA